MSKTKQPWAAQHDVVEQACWQYQETHRSWESGPIVFIPVLRRAVLPIPTAWNHAGINAAKEVIIAQLVEVTYGQLE